jgi:ribose transport system ATP-binding protein
MQLDGETYRPRNPLDARLGGVVMIYQELSLASHLSVEENILLGLEPARFGFIRRREQREKAMAALAAFDHPEISPDALVRQLSISARQLVEIARGLALGCRVLVLDEPTSSLTQRDVERLFRVIRKIKQDGHAVIYISHFIEEVKQIADRFTVLRDGRTVGGGSTAETTPDQIVALMVGRRIAELFPHSPRTPGEVIVEIAGVAGFQKPTAASLTLHRGEVLGIAGLVGAGRTELLRVLFGLDPVRRGNIRLGAYVGPASPVQRWAQGVGLLSEDRKTEGLALSLSVADNLTLTRLPRAIFPARQRAAAQRWIERLGIRCTGPNQSVAALSGGNQQKVALARLLHHDVDVLLLDEPTRGIDVGSKVEIYRLIDELASRGKAVLMVSSYLPELLGVCDRIAVMCRGRLHPAHRVEDTDEHAIILEATTTTT